MSEQPPSPGPSPRAPEASRTEASTPVISRPEGSRPGSSEAGSRSGRSERRCDADAEGKDGCLRIYLLQRGDDGWELDSPVLRRRRRNGGQRRNAYAEGNGAGNDRGEPSVWTRALEWIRNRGNPSEKVLRELHHPAEVEVVHPAKLDEGQAERLYQEVLEALVRRHRRWLLVNGSLLPVGVLATVVPGPNVWLAYLAWRALAHFRSQRGGSRALGELTPRFVAEPLLDRLAALQKRRLVWRRRHKLRQLRERLGLPGA